MRKIYAFDFDGTLTTKDTLLEFIHFAKGSGQMFCGFLNRKLQKQTIKEVLLAE